MRRHERSIFFIGVATALCLAGTLGGTAFAGPANGVKGDPQPEAKPFRVSNQDTSPASIAFEPNGSLVAAYDVPGGKTGRAFVCVLNRGQRSCARQVKLGTPSTGDGWDTSYGPHVLVPSANHVILVGDVCCDDNPNGDTLMYSSTDGGRSFGPFVRIGNVTVGGAVLIGKQIVFIGADFPQGVQVEDVPVGATGQPAEVATLAPYRNDVGIGAYHGGVLAAYDYDGPIWQTFVKYAPDHSDFNNGKSYSKVITIDNESLIGASGNALVTIQTNRKQAVELRLFNGKGFGSAHTVPGTSGGGPEWFGVDQSPGGGTHVFTERASTGYDLVEYSTSNGTHWTNRNLGSAIDSYSFSAGLDSRGTGLILGPGASQVTAFPVLQAQTVSLSLKSSSIRKGRSTTATGKVRPAGAGRLVTLQVERSGKWYDVSGATAHEKSNGTFRFAIKGKSAGTFSYRAVVTDLAGYLLFGYSNARSLRVN
jgi:hypothetical protein